MINIFSDMLITALYAMALQNLVFNASYGLSESIRMAKRPKHFIMYGSFVTFFCLSTSLICALLCKMPLILNAPMKITYIIFVLVLSVIYLITGAVFKGIFNADKKFMNSLSMCAFNTLIIALPALNMKAGNDILTSFSLGIGAGLAFILSMLLIRNGMRHINKNPHIPDMFKGTPALFIYVSLISLALSCISGEALFL